MNLSNLKILRIYLCYDMPKTLLRGSCISQIGREIYLKLEIYLELHNWALKIRCYNDKFRLPALMFYNVTPVVVKDSGTGYPYWQFFPNCSQYQYINIKIKLLLCWRELGYGFGWNVSILCNIFVHVQNKHGFS